MTEPKNDEVTINLWTSTSSLSSKLREYAIRYETAGDVEERTSFTNEMEAAINQLIARKEKEAVGAEHYYSHKGRLEAGYAELYFCACGKYDQNRDRLLRHIAWHELKLKSKQGDK